jgi:hypothetical protein
LAIECLESRQLLSVTPLAVPAGEISLLRHGIIIQTFDPASETDVDRGTALRTALAAAQDNDEILLGAYTFDMGGTSHVEFPDRVTVTGAGKELTKITSSCPQSVDGAATFTLNNETAIQDCWLEGSLQNGLYQPLVGMQGGPTEDVTAYLRSVKITGDSDGIFVWTGSLYTYTIYGYDCDITTNYDAVAVLGSGANPQTVKLYNSTITVGQPDPINAHVSNGVNARSGMVGLYNCTVTATGDSHSLQTTGVWTWNQGSAEVVNTTFHVSAGSGSVDDLRIQNATSITVTGGAGSGPDGEYISTQHNETVVAPVPSTVVSRTLFYNNSAYDSNEPRPLGHDDGPAIATDKTPLFFGNKATFANVSSYSRGINGIAIDLSGKHGSITADDFEFKVGNNNAPSTWAAAPAPSSVTVFGKDGLGGSDRVEIIWDDRAIFGKWLQVTMLADVDTGLAAPDTFFFGSAPGDSGRYDTTNFSIVDGNDELAARNNPASVLLHIPITNIYDYNRDATVDGNDQLFARNNQTGIGTALRFLDLTSASAAAAVADPAVAAAYALLRQATQYSADVTPAAYAAAPLSAPTVQGEPASSLGAAYAAAFEEIAADAASDMPWDDELLASLSADGTPFA